jgi:hypothetical protein
LFIPKMKIAAAVRSFDGLESGERSPFSRVAVSLLSNSAGGHRHHQSPRATAAKLHSTASTRRRESVPPMSVVGPPPAQRKSDGRRRAESAVHEPESLKTRDIDDEQPPPPPTSLCAWLPPRLARSTRGGTGSVPREPRRRFSLLSSPHELRRCAAPLQTRQAAVPPRSQPRRATRPLRAGVYAPRSPRPIMVPSRPPSAISA